MKKINGLLIFFIGLLFIVGCEVKDPSQPQLDVTKSQLALSKVIAVGNSLTAGFQSAGMMEDFQMHSYPYFVAMSMGKTEFEQPIIGTPGIGSSPGKTPLRFDNGKIIADDLTVDPITLLKNALLPRPYDNLGIPGATLGDVTNAYNSTSSESGNNPFFDMVLRNPNFGNMTQLQQAIVLNPTLIMLWIGNNDVLGAALGGGNLDEITPQDVFKTRYTELLSKLRQNTRSVIIGANIPYVTDIPFINTLDIIFRAVPALGINNPVPVVFDSNLQPVDFGGGMYLPLLTEEFQLGVVHLTIPALSAYQSGIGVPDSAALVNVYGLPPAQASAIVQGMIGAGLTPTGVPLPGTVSLTLEESQEIKDAVDGFNATIALVAQQFQVPVVDANAMLTELNTNGIDGFSGKFVLLDPANTAFSLDGVHPNNGGYALVANSFIDKINAVLGTSVPKLNAADYKGQYIGQKVETIALEAANQVIKIFQ